MSDEPRDELKYTFRTDQGIAIDTSSRIVATLPEDEVEKIAQRVVQILHDKYQGAA